VQVNNDADIFIIDCEGLYSLGETTATLKQATLALAHLASMAVLVMSQQVNRENINDVRSLFVMSHAFTRAVPGFEVGTTVMMRDIGVRIPKGESPSLADKNRLRQDADVRERSKILEVLNQAHVKFSERDFLVLGQPAFDDSELYWKSIEDFLTFCVTIQSRRARFSGEVLLQIHRMPLS
jgi:hypothetical protein